MQRINPGLPSNRGYNLHNENTNTISKVIKITIPIFMVLAAITFLPFEEGIFATIIIVSFAAIIYTTDFRGIFQDALRSLPQRRRSLPVVLEGPLVVTSPLSFQSPRSCIKREYSSIAPQFQPNRPPVGTGGFTPLQRHLIQSDNPSPSSQVDRPILLDSLTSLLQQQQPPQTRSQPNRPPVGTGGFTPLQQPAIQSPSSQSDRPITSDIFTSFLQQRPQETRSQPNRPPVGTGGFTPIKIKEKPQRR